VTPPTGPLFGFLRYDAALEADWLSTHLGETLSADELSGLRRMDDPAIIPTVYRLGRKAAELQMRREHLAGPAA